MKPTVDQVIESLTKVIDDALNEAYAEGRKDQAEESVQTSLITDEDVKRVWRDVHKKRLEVADRWNRFHSSLPYELKRKWEQL